MHTDGQTDMTKPVVTFHNFVNMHENCSRYSARYEYCEDSHFLGCDTMYVDTY